MIEARISTTALPTNNNHPIRNKQHELAILDIIRMIRVKLLAIL